MQLLAEVSKSSLLVDAHISHLLISELAPSCTMMATRSRAATISAPRCRSSLALSLRSGIILSSWRCRLAMSILTVWSTRATCSLATLYVSVLARSFGVAAYSCGAPLRCQLAAYIPTHDRHFSNDAELRSSKLHPSGSCRDARHSSVRNSDASQIGRCEYARNTDSSTADTRICCLNVAMYALSLPEGQSGGTQLSLSSNGSGSRTSMSHSCRRCGRPQKAEICLSQMNRANVVRCR